MRNLRCNSFERTNALARIVLYAANVFLFFAATVCCLAAATYRELDDKRISQIEAMLPAQPAGFGRPITDRAFWSSAMTREAASNVVVEAKALLGKDFPAWSDELYQEFSRNGTRPPAEKMLRARSAWLYPLVVAECVENQGRFLSSINKVLREYANEPTWVLPAHDWGLENFHGRKCTIDLRSSEFGADLAQAVYLLDGKIDTDVRKQLVNAIEARLFVPFRQSLITGKGHHWLGSEAQPVQNNWNAVCLAGVAGAARTLMPDRHERAVFLAAGEHYSQYFINGFRADGYCEEGAGYWGYGFGKYVLLREILADATAGRVDLFANPKIRKIAEYGIDIQMMDGLAPPFADCRFGTKVDANLVAYCQQTLGLGNRGDDSRDAPGRKTLSELFRSETPCAASRGKTDRVEGSAGLRSLFDVTGVLICRPAPGGNSQISAAIKAGGNGSHSHNDIGAFVIAIGGTQLVGDPGGPHAYDNKTFGPERYARKILNSFGHPVPVVAGQLQVDATKVHPKVLKTKFTAERDEFQIDLKPAYDVPELKSLIRTMSYSRAGAGEVVIRDNVSFTSLQTFEVAIPTLGNFRRAGEHGIEFEFEGKKLLAEIQTPDGFEMTTERIEELGAPAFTRVGFKLLKPVKQAEVVVTFKPVSETAGLFPAGVKRVLFLGDSITYSGQYVEVVAAYHKARFPGSKIEFVNVGLSSETVSGLSEPGHAGGKFPRPDLHERLARVLEKTKPDFVFACYGMNDGIYLPLDEQRFKAFREGVTWLRAEVQNAHAKMVHVTPPVFDEIKGGHAGYTAVLDRYSEWLVSQRTNGWDVVDLHTPMRRQLEQQRTTNSAYAFSRDGIHPDNFGHWLMAQAILLHLGADEVASATSAGDLLKRFPDGDQVLRREHQEMVLWRDAWLTATGHKRPGVKPGLPMVIDPKTGQARLLTNSPSKNP